MREAGTSFEAERDRSATYRLENPVFDDRPGRGVVVDLRRGPISVEIGAQPSGQLAASGPALLVKRVIDVAGALIGLVLLSPLFLLTALAVAATSSGPALYRQRRVGKDRREFSCFKFRSMEVDAETRLEALSRHNESTGPVFKMRHDPRVTPVGRFIRRSSIDELPQLWNVLRGDMSLVGPRPPLPGEVALYSTRELQRLFVKPGLTGLWQVSGRSDIDFETWIEMDLEYIETWSLGLDLRLLFLTIPAVLSGRGAY